ncbi:hypothetical protein IC627_22970 (plasmid) [Photobacterium damselae subsp. piscicida]|uniref:Uncharacterized protein n=1 Tax=Photobacterium damsela subsp. piscicida TaxID=38294 RepID=A0A1V1VHN6_PHODP|nr:hypothetical protein [Photobacterium damselae]MBE8126578.1 hypothetical protein [Photobacterium damselae subsp. piscicida]PSV50196.1 hypothetical protein CTT35_18005 [Photobacterium damselae]QOD55259.1 hypothetical protein IC628_22860 [Photobacterium damselae subsp. piscicida]QOD59084.1 hypothetical protein IC627_22970 [Photobacterium damselae subsp. piscicida]GAW47640.1 hypothetical protein PDPJ_6_00034 [Photobacterium damselae subsp. piscicida]
MASKKEKRTGLYMFDDGSIEYAPDFKSTVFADEYEMMVAHQPLSRDPYKTIISMNGIAVTVDRQKEQTEMILRQQAEAIVSIEKHYAEGGSELMLEIPDWTSKQDTRINRH